MTVSIKKISILFILIAIIAIFSIYSNTINSPFFFDDFNNIENPILQVDELSFKSIYDILFEGTIKTRPISNISFALNYYMGEYTVQGYHVFNMAVHIFAGIFLYYVITITLLLPVNASRYQYHTQIAFFASLIWLVHPVATQSVTYIVQRMNSMAAMFYILAVLLYLMGRKRQQVVERRQGYFAPWVLFAGATLAGLLALGSKEIAATLPIVIFFYEWFFFQDLKWSWVRKKVLWILGVVFILYMLSTVYLGYTPWQVFFSDCFSRDFTAPERLMTQFRVVMHYVGLLIYPDPSRLLFDYNFSISKSLLEPVTTIISLIAIIFSMLVSLAIARKERLLSFCIVWFYCTLMMESSVICLELVFEHRTYLPSTFFYLFLVAILFRLRVNVKVISIFLVCIALLFSVWTYQRNTIWSDVELFWQDSVDKAPLKPRPHVNLGNVFFKQQRYDLAEEQYLQALELKPEFPQALNNLGLVYYHRGDFEQAIAVFLKAKEISPGYLDPYNNLSTIFAAQGEIDRAIDMLRDCLAVLPEYYLGNKNLGQLLLKKGAPEEALQHFTLLLQKNPNRTEVLEGVASAHRQMGDRESALAVYKRILEINPDAPHVHFEMAKLYAELGDGAMAMEQYKRTVDFAPHSVPVLYNYGNSLLRAGKIDAAAEQYQKVVQMVPELSNTYNNLGLIWIEKGMYEKARLSFENALRIMPGNQMAQQNLNRIQSQVNSVE